MATYDFQQFTASLAKGNARTNRFEVQINLPLALQVAYEGQKDLNIRLESVSFPGKNIRTVTNENVYGPTYEMAQGLTYAESVAMNFYLSSSHFERTYFMNWLDMIVKPDSYNLEYYDNYKRNISIYQMNKTNERTAGIKLLDCYPKTIGAIEYSQENGEVGQISVEFVFKEHVHIDGSGRLLNEKYAPAVKDLQRRQRGQNVAVHGGLEIDPRGGVDTF